MNAIDVRNLTKTFRSHIKQEGLKNSFFALFHREFKEHTAVNDVSFSIDQGELVGMLGANGAGKTTILKILSSLLFPTSGNAKILGFTPWERKNDFKKLITIVMGQRNQLWWDLPAADSFLLLKEMYQIPDDDFKKRRDELAERLNITDKLHIQVRRLSLGERMKCELIAALLHNPRVVFLDEPTIGLDVVAQQVVRDFVQNYSRETEATIILTSHYMDDIEALCDRVILIDEGKLAFDGSLHHLTKKYAEDKILTIIFRGHVSRQDVESFGIITDFMPEKVSIRVPRLKIAETAAALLTNFTVADLTIEEVPIEDIIRKIFSI